MKANVLVKILAVLGFGSGLTACELPALYGMPPVDWINMEGTVTNEAGQPIGGIRVQGSSVRSNTEDDILTDSEGRYSVSGYLKSGSSVLLEFDDIDGEANGGNFASTAVEIARTVRIVPPVALVLKEPVCMYGVPNVPFREIQDSDEQ